MRQMIKSYFRIIGSMNKFKDKHSIENWFKKYDGYFVVSDKLDGSSALLEFKNGEIKMWSRGNGVEGRDISHLLKYMTIPKLNENITLRGELIISKLNFEKYKQKYSNSRSMVNGLLGHNNPSSDLASNLDYVVFEIINDNLSLYKQLDYAKKLDLKHANTMIFILKIN